MVPPRRSMSLHLNFLRPMLIYRTRERAVQWFSGPKELHQGDGWNPWSVCGRTHFARPRNEGTGLQEVPRSVSTLVISGRLDSVVQILQILKFQKLNCKITKTVFTEFLKVAIPFTTLNLRLKFVEVTSSSTWALV